MSSLTDNLFNREMERIRAKLEADADAERAASAQARALDRGRVYQRAFLGVFEEDSKPTGHYVSKAERKEHNNQSVLLLLNEALVPELAKHLGNTVGLTISRNFTRRDYELVGFCTRCKAQFARYQASSPTPVGVTALAERHVRELIPSHVVAVTGYDGQITLEAEARIAGERARQREIAAFTASRVAQAMRPVVCSCVRDYLAEHHGPRTRDLGHERG